MSCSGNPLFRCFWPLLGLGLLSACGGGGSPAVSPVPGAPAPVVTAVTPDPVPAAALPQTLTVTGQNFAEGARLAFTNPEGLPSASVAEDLTRDSATQLRYAFNNLNVVGNWTLRVINPDGQQSAPLSFRVKVPGRVFFITPGEDATEQMLSASTQLSPGDVIQFDCGFFDLKKTLLINQVEDVTIKGCGRDKTALSFRNNTASPEGILISSVAGIVIEDLTVLDSGGNGFELRAVNHGTLRRVRALWSSNGGQQSPDPVSAENYLERLATPVPCTDPPTLNPNAPENQFPGADTSSPDYTVSEKSGRYGIYPVSSENILIDEAESVGASDAGIYVGQTNTAIIRNSRAVYNVFGFEIENVQGGEYQNNIAECNTGGFLIYDLDNLRQYGDRSRMYGNISRNNNTYNFTAGGFVANVPPGSGMITLSYDRIDVFENIFENNNTGGIIHASYELFPEGAGRPAERRIDFYTEGMHIFRNTFINNGNGLPRPTTTDLQNGDVARVLPALVGLKNQAACLDPRNAATCLAAGGTGYRGAHIVWDGLLDSLNAECPYPEDANREPVPQDERGKPLYNNEHPNPACRYNAYKFDTAQTPAVRRNPDWFASCIDDDNSFSADSLTYANFNGTKGLEAVIAAATASQDGAGLMQVVASLPTTDAQNFASSFDLKPHQCVATYGRNLELLPPVVIPPFVPTGEFDPAPPPEVVDELCGAEVEDGQVNFSAATVDCPQLDQYHLFADPQDPTSAPRGGGLPYALNTKLFTDYSVKYRVAYLPPGTQAVYRDAATDGVNSTLVFPTGTIIAKTFSFLDEQTGAETAIETRLLIRRVNSAGRARWVGLPYIWETTEGGQRVARLRRNGGTAAVSWHYTDPDSGLLHSGSTASYAVPSANQCLSCHANEDLDPGTAPIGPKVRNLNRPYASESSRESGQSGHESAGVNQIQYWCSTGRLAGCPEDLGVDPQSQIAANLERLPIFNKPGDAGFAAHSDEDVEARARAWLEVNCQHCHNVRGFAANTGYYLDHLRVMDLSYGICKSPTATGFEGSGGRTIDVFPGDPARSILEFRISEAATTAAARMPPLARSVVDVEGHALIERWIRDVVIPDENRYPGSTSCTGG